MYYSADTIITEYIFKDKYNMILNIKLQIHLICMPNVLGF